MSPEFIINLRWGYLLGLPFAFISYTISYIEYIYYNDELTYKPSGNPATLPPDVNSIMHKHVSLQHIQAGWCILYNKQWSFEQLYKKR